MYGHDCCAKDEGGKCTTLTDDDCEDVACYLQLLYRVESDVRM